MFEIYLVFGKVSFDFLLQILLMLNQTIPHHLRLAQINPPSLLRNLVVKIPTRQKKTRKFSISANILFNRICYYIFQFEFK